METFKYYSANNGIRADLVREGINPDQVFSHASEESRKVFLRGFVEQISVVSEKLSGPLDDILIKGFDRALDAKTLLRKSGNRSKLSEAEIWWEGQGHSLKSSHQKEIAIHWLAENIIPTDILNDLDSVSNGQGKYWKQKFLDISEKMLYVFPRYGFSDSLSSFVSGFSTLGELSIAGVGGLASNFVASESEARGGQAFDHYWATYRPLIADFKKAFKNSKVDLNVNVAINEILWGAYEKFNFDISNMYQKTTWLATSVGIATALGITKGKAGLVQAIAFSLGSKWLGKKYPELVSEEILKDVVEKSVELSQKIIDLNEEREKLSEVYDEIGIGKEIQDLIEKDSINDKKKGVFLSFSEKQTTHAIAWITGFISNGTLASGSMIAQSILYSAMRNINNKTTYDYRRELREKALEKFRKAFDELKGSRGIIRNTTETKISLIGRKKLEIAIKSIGVPEFKNSKGITVNKFVFEKGFKIKSGNIYPVFGPNASGKTTLVDVLAGKKLGDPSLTVITVNKVDFNNLSSKELRRSVRFISRSDLNFDLKTTCAEILMNHSTNLFGLKVDKDRIKSWVLGKDNYPEVETSIIEFINSQTDMLAIDSNWFRDKKYIPSGMQQSVLKIVLSLMINEPILLITDETAGEMTDDNSKKFRTFIENMDLGKMAFMPILNKDIKDWLSLTKIGGTINTEREVAGRMVYKSKDNNFFILNEDFLNEIKKRVEEGKLVKPDEFLLVDQDAKNTDFISKNIKYWISNLEETKGKSKQNERFGQAISLLRILNLNKNIDCNLDVIREVAIDGSFSFLNAKLIRNKSTQVKVAGCYELVTLYNKVVQDRTSENLIFNSFNYDEYVRSELEHTIKIFSLLERDDIVKTVLVNTDNSETIELFRRSVIKGLKKLKESDINKTIKKLGNLYGSPLASSRKSVWETLNIKDY